MRVFYAKFNFFSITRRRQYSHYVLSSTTVFSTRVNTHASRYSTLLYSCTTRVMQVVVPLLMLLSITIFQYLIVSILIVRPFLSLLGVTLIQCFTNSVTVRKNKKRVEIYKIKQVKKTVQYYEILAV